MHWTTTSSLLLSLLSAAGLSSASLDCGSIVVEDHEFNLKALKGPHSVVTTRFESSTQSHFNTTYTIDICDPLKKKDGEKTTSCPNGTRACAITHLLSDDKDTVEKVVAIAGSLENAGGSAFEYEVTRLKTSDSNSDSKKEGLRLVLKGGKHPLTGPIKERKAQKAVIEFLCDHEKEGTEGEWESADKYEKGSKVRRDDKDEGDEGESGEEHQLKNDDAALLWEGYGDEKDGGVLRLSWHTKHACEKRDGDKGGDGDGKDGDEDTSSSHWGFFTWFVIIVFLGIAAYLIFGSWLNYNRYGARGWDLLPHGDTIRDIPYLLKDWTRRVLNTVQGAGSRGGYSAV